MCAPLLDSLWRLATETVEYLLVFVKVVVSRTTNASCRNQQERAAAPWIIATSQHTTQLASGQASIPLQPCVCDMQLIAYGSLITVQLSAVSAQLPLTDRSSSIVGVAFEL